MKIVIIGEFSETSRKMILGQFPAGWRVVLGAAEEVEPELTDAEVIIPEHVRVDGPFLDRAPKLKLVQTGAGFDNVVISECTKRGICVANAAGVNATAVAEHVLAFIFCWYKNMIHLDAMVKRGADGADYAGAEVAGKTVGIIGIGRIGRAVAARALALEMKVLGYGVRPVEVGAELQMTDLKTLLSFSDVITLHCRLNDQTRHMIGRRELDSMKPSAFLINALNQI